MTESDRELQLRECPFVGGNDPKGEVWRGGGTVDGLLGRGGGG